MTRRWRRRSGLTESARAGRCCRAAVEQSVSLGPRSVGRRTGLFTTVEKIHPTQETKTVSFQPLTRRVQRANRREDTTHRTRCRFHLWRVHRARPRTLPSTLLPRPLIVGPWRLRSSPQSCCKTRRTCCGRRWPAGWSCFGLLRATSRGLGDWERLGLAWARRRSPSCTNRGREGRRPKGGRRRKGPSSA